jgi:hypothetical protein
MKPLMSMGPTLHVGAAGAAGAGVAAGVGAGAGVAGVCAPAIRAIAMAAPAIDCSMRFVFMFIGAVPPKKNLLYDEIEFSQK